MTAEKERKYIFSSCVSVTDSHKTRSYTEGGREVAHFSTPLPLKCNENQLAWHDSLNPEKAKAAPQK